MTDIKLTELVESAKRLTDEELQLADSGLRKMLTVVQQEIRRREIKRKTEKNNKKNS